MPNNQEFLCYLNHAAKYNEKTKKFYESWHRRLAASSNSLGAPTGSALLQAATKNSRPTGNNHGKALEGSQRWAETGPSTERASPFFFLSTAFGLGAGLINTMLDKEKTIWRESSWKVKWEIRERQLSIWMPLNVWHRGWAAQQLHGDSAATTENTEFWVQQSQLPAYILCLAHTHTCIHTHKHSSWEG